MGWIACEDDDEEWDEEDEEDNEFELDWTQPGGNLKRILVIHFQEYKWNDLINTNYKSLIIFDCLHLQ